LNKAFVKEPDPDARVSCPRCGNLATEVGRGPLDTHVLPEHRQRLGDRAWCCSSESCDVVYFDAFGQSVRVVELRKAVYPYKPDAPLCACFGLTMDDIEADVNDGVPVRIRELYAKSQSAEARCATLAVDGQCCLREVQRIYLKWRSQG
jgi:hypothetical protein